MSKGFSLIEIMVASVIMSVVGLSVSTLINNQAKQVTYLEDRMSHQNLKKQIEDVLADSSSCLNTTLDVQLPTGFLSTGNGTDIEIKDRNNLLAFNSSTIYDGLKIKSIKLKNVNITATSLDGKAIIDVEIERTRSGSSAEKQQMKSVQIEKSISVDPSLKVVGCASDSTAALSCLTSYAPSGLYSVSTNRSVCGLFVASCNVISYPHTIPADAKLIKFYTPSFTYDRNNIGVTGSGNTTDSDYVTVPATDISIPLNGQAKTSDGTVIRPGGTINRISSYGGASITYNGRTILRQTTVSGGQGQSITNSYQSQLRSTASVSVCDEEGLMNRHDLTYYK